MTPEQIRKALKADIITQEQADVMLAGKAASEAPADSAAVIGQEDNMRFLRSFSDVFIGLGLRPLRAEAGFI
jgi:hypothetical protein